MNMSVASGSQSDYEMDNSIQSRHSNQKKTQSDYSIFFSDSTGNLRFLAAPSSKQDLLPNPIRVNLNIPTHLIDSWNENLVGNKNRAVQRVAEGCLKDGSWVIALARKDSTIDVVRPDSPLPSSPIPTSSKAQGKQSASTSEVQEQPEEPVSVNAELLFSIKETRMKAGIERWVGLAVAEDGIYSCSSSGFFSFTPLNLNSTSSTFQSPSSSSQKFDLPSPLQTLIFHPSSNPTHFAYGGEEIPISLWDLKLAISTPGSSTQASKGDQEKGEEDSPIETAEETSSKIKKRKRQAEIKAANKELMWGEIWRAKNLPNDYLSLPQRANITALTFLCPSTQAISTASSDSEIPSVQLAVGTKEGLIRVYNPSSGVRKHVAEHKIIPKSQNTALTVKSLVSGLNEGEVFVSDTTGKLYAVDWRSGAILYSYKDINGAAVSLLPLPLPLSPNSKENSKSTTSTPALLFSACQDDQIRLHSTNPPTLTKNAANATSPTVEKRGETLYSIFSIGKAPVGIVWNGTRPVGEIKVQERESKEEEVGSDEGEDEDEDDEEVWEGLQEVGGNGKSNTRSKESGKVKENGDDEDERDEEKEKESRSKRSRG